MIFHRLLESLLFTEEKSAANVGTAIATIIARASRNIGMRFLIVDI